MSGDIISEGTRVKVLRYEKRPEFVGQEGEVGNWSEKDKTYEVWLIADEFDGCYALCLAEDVEVVTVEPPKLAEPAPAPAPEGPQKPAVYGIGDRVKGKESEKLGTVIAVDDDGDPKVLMDGASEPLQRFGSEFVVEKAKYLLGDRVRGKETGKVGTVVFVDEDGDPKVLMDDEGQPQQRYGNEFEVVEKGMAAPGPSTKEKDRGKKKKKKQSSSSESESSRSSSSPSPKKKMRSAFGRSFLEKQEDDRRKRKQREKDFKKKAGAGAHAALRVLGLKALA